MFVASRKPVKRRGGTNKSATSWLERAKNHEEKAIMAIQAWRKPDMQGCDGAASSRNCHSATRVVERVRAKVETPERVPEPHHVPDSRPKDHLLDRQLHTQGYSGIRISAMCQCAMCLTLCSLLPGASQIPCYAGPPTSLRERWLDRPGTVLPG